MKQAQHSIAQMFQGAPLPIGEHTQRGTYRDLPVSFRELLGEAKAYHGHGWNAHDSAHLALDTIAPYHEMLRSH